jgi:hypothetical protein
MLARGRIGVAPSGNPYFIYDLDHSNLIAGCNTLLLIFRRVDTAGAHRPWERGRYRSAERPDTGRGHSQEKPKPLENLPNEASVVHLDVILIRFWIPWAQSQPLAGFFFIEIFRAVARAAGWLTAYR